MSDGGVSTEELSKGKIENTKSRWAWLTKLKHIRQSKPTESLPIQQEVAATIPDGSGYAELVQQYKYNPELGSEYLARLLEKEYPDLIKELQSEQSLEEGVKQVLLEAINGGDADTIAVVMARLLENAKLKTTEPPDKIKGRKVLATQMKNSFINKQVAQDNSDRFNNIKLQWAAHNFREGVQNPKWIPEVVKPNKVNPPPVQMLSQRHS